MYPAISTNILHLSTNCRTNLNVYWLYSTIFRKNKVCIGVHTWIFSPRFYINPLEKDTTILSCSDKSHKVTMIRVDINYDVKGWQTNVSKAVDHGVIGVYLLSAECQCVRYYILQCMLSTQNLQTVISYFTHKHNPTLHCILRCRFFIHCRHYLVFFYRKHSQNYNDISLLNLKLLNRIENLTKIWCSEVT